MRYLPIIIPLLVLASCLPGNNGSSGWNTGGKGASITVEYPKTYVKIGRELRIPVEVENLGSNDKEITVCAHDYDPNVIFGQNSVCRSVFTKGKTELVPEGFGPQEILFQTGYNVQDTTSGFFTQNIAFTACYRDRTLATPTLFIDKAEEKAEIQNLQSSQGAPVSVSKVNVNIYDPAEVYMEVHLSNSGGGMPYALNQPTSNCHKVPELEQGYITVRVEDFNCGDGLARFPSKPYVECTRSTSGLGERVYTPITIEVTYNYMQKYSAKKVEFEGNKIS